MILENYCLSIPCKTYIAKYYGSRYGTPIDLNSRQFFHDTILMKLSHEPPKPLPKYKLQIAVKNLDAQIKFRLPFDLFYRIDNEITENKIWSVNRYLEKGFECDLGKMVAMANCFGVEKRTAIEALSSHYGIILEEDITLDALKKKEQRFRKTTTFLNSFLATLSSAPQINLRA